jgi:hypothetical protein
MTHTRKRIAMLVISLASLLAMAISASAQSSGSGTLTPGSNICVGPFFADGYSPGQTSIELSGQVTNNVIASPKWSIWRSPDDTTYSKIFATHAFGLTQDIIANQSPQYFPGYFLGCLNNDTAVTIDFIISIGPGQY